ncbi:MAG TPA: hypothetical protein DCX07_12230 [Phycisphaerales bacterium]|nr:hypothetical protein [Phycisphaerales bacterium]
MPRYTIVHKPLDPKASWFPKLRFGMFVHFGLYSIPARDEWMMNHERIAFPEYRKLMKRFNPRRFDARQWVRSARQAGAKYIALTAKHHDGFCLFDSALTDYKITNTPFGRDLVGEVVDACHRDGMRIVLYYSQPDWAHPCYVPAPGCLKDWRVGSPTDTPDWPAYLRYLFGQVEELCTKYGRIDGLWFDGMNKGESEWRGRALYRMIKRLQPHAVVNDRAGCGDCYTPERRLATAAAAMGYMVEACDCVARGAWCYMPDPEMQSSPALIRNLVRMAGAGGNYLLNIGPKADGTLPESWMRRFRDVGAWLGEFGASIYGTQGCPRNEESPDRLYTRKGKRLYLHLLQWPETNRLTLTRLARAPRRAKLMGSGQTLGIETVGGNVVLKGLPAAPLNAAVNVVEMTFAAESFLRPPAPWPVPAPLKFDGVRSLEVRLTDAPGVFLSFKGLPLPTHPFRGQLPEDFSNLWMPYHRISWRMHSARAAWVEVSLEVAAGANSQGSTFALRAGDSELQGVIPPTASWTDFTTVRLGRLRLPKGNFKLTMVPLHVKFPGRFGVVRKLILSPGKRRPR